MTDLRRIHHLRPLDDETPCEPNPLPQTVARHGGRCGMCDEPIVEGDALMLLDGEWVHAECGTGEAA